MIPFGALVVVTLVVRSVGFLGIEGLDGWSVSCALGLAASLALTATAHFNKLQADLAAMVPPRLPAPKRWVQLTGVLEFLGLVGLLVPVTRTPAGICLAVLFVLLFPANFSAARRGTNLSGRPVTPLVLRAPMQICFIIAALVAAS